MVEQKSEQQKLEEALIANLQNMQSNLCTDCSISICNHEALFSIVTGYKKDPRCCTCLASDIGKDREELRDQMYQHIQRRPCWRTGWQWCNQQEQFSLEQKPSCLWK